MAHVALELVRAGRIGVADAARGVTRALAASVSIEPLFVLALPALALANERGLSASDACYVVLAERPGATLVTADRRLAAATPNTVLIID